MSALPVETTVVACRSCEEGLAHCHGTAIVHAHGVLECTEEPACDLPEEAHPYVVLCVELDGGCC